MNRFAVRSMLVALFVGAPVVTAAQAPRVEFNLGVGPTIPSGDVSSRLPMGYNLAAGLGFTAPGSALGFRVEGLYDAFNGRNNYTIVCGAGSSCSRNSYATGLTLNLKYEGLLPYNGRPGERHRGGRSSLYVIGGFGFYNVHAPIDGGFTPGGSFGYENRTRAYTGWNVGGGLRIPAGGASLYIEARLHIMTQAQVPTRFVPITVGVIF